MKKITVAWEATQYTINLRGNQWLIDQITEEIKKITFYCKGSELTLIDPFLLNSLKETFQKKVFVVSNLFASDAGANTFLLLKAGRNYLMLNNNELRVPMFIYSWSVRSWDKMIENSNTLHYSLGNNKKFKLISKQY